MNNRVNINKLKHYILDLVVSWNRTQEHWLHLPVLSPMSYDNHTTRQPSALHNPLYTTQVVLNALVAYQAATMYVPSEHCYESTRNITPSGVKPCKCIVTMLMLCWSCFTMKTNAKFVHFPLSALFLELSIYFHCEVWSAKQLVWILTNAWGLFQL